MGGNGSRPFQGPNNFRHGIIVPGLKPRAGSDVPDGDHEPTRQPDLPRAAEYSPGFQPWGTSPMGTMNQRDSQVCPVRAAEYNPGLQLWETAADGV